MAFPVAGYISDAARTVAQMKAALEDFLAATKLLGGTAAETTKTISSGSVTPDAAFHSIDTEAAAATDDLTNIVTTNFDDGSVIWIRPASAARVVTVKHNAGGAGQVSLLGGLDAVLNSTRKWMVLKRVGADWQEVGRFGFPDKVPYANAAAVTGTGDAVVLTFPDPYPAAWEIGQEGEFVAEATNTITAPTVNPNSLGTKVMTDIRGDALPAGTIVVGRKYRYVYDGTVARLDIDLKNAQIDKSNAWAAGQTPQAVTLSDAATVAWDASTGQQATVTATAARTFGAPTNLSSGRSYRLIIINSGGAWNHSFNAAFVWQQGQSAPTGIPSGGRAILDFVCQGSNLHNTSVAIFAS